MGEITLFAEPVFTEAYWEPIVELPETEQRDFRPLSQRGDIKQLCTQAAFNIFSGAPREAAAGGTVLDYAPDNPFIQPGNVLLVDSEYVSPASDHDEEQCSDDLIRYKSDYMEDEYELMASPALLFRSNSRRYLPFIREPVPPAVFPYRKILCNPATKMHFVRRVELVAVGYDGHGETAEPERVKIWNVRNSNDEISGTFRLRDAFKGFRFPLPRTVGQAYQVDDTAEGTGGAYRIRSVELCHSGKLERAPAKSKLVLPRFTFGRSATPQPI